MTTVANLPRPVMKEVGRAILTRLEERKVAGPPEAALDDYITDLTPIVTGLETRVTGQVVADAARTATLARSEAADIDVDTRLRHHHSYIRVEAGRRAGPNVAAAQALADAAFPDGLDQIDDYVPDENRMCRDAIIAIRSPAHAPTVIAIELPPGWTTSWELALDESDAAYAALEKARADKTAHVGAGQDAEQDFVEMMVRFRRYIGSRAARTDKAKIAEGRHLMAPLLDALAKAKAEASARATRKANATDPTGSGDPT